MPSQATTHCKCEPYLVKFLEFLYGPSPISFPRKSNFNLMLDAFLEKPPMECDTPDQGILNLAIRLPYFDNKDIRSYNYLPPKKQEIFAKEIWKFFKIIYRNEISKCLVMGLDRKDAIGLFIEKYDLSDDCWDSLEKDYQRHLTLRRKARLFRNKKNSAV